MNGSNVTFQNSASCELTLISNSGNDSGVYFNNGTGNAGAVIYDHPNNKLKFRINSSKTAEFDSNGKFFPTALSVGPGILEESYHNDTGGGIQSNYNHDILTYGTIFYGVTNAVANFTFNVRGNSTTTYNSMTEINKTSTVTVYVAANSKYMTEFRIDANVQTVKWAGGVAPFFGSPSGVDVYSFTIMKTAADTYHVFGNVTNFD